MIVPELNINTYKMFKEFLKRDTDYYYPYAWWEKHSGLDRNQIKEYFKPLKKIGIIQYAKGLIDEEGSVRGSGFTVNDDWLVNIELAVRRFEDENKNIPQEAIMLDGRRYVLESKEKV